MRQWPKEASEEKQAGQRTTFLGLLLFATLGVFPVAASTDPANPSPPVDPARARYIEQLDKSEQEREESHKKSMENLEQSARNMEETHKRNLEHLDREEKTFDRYEADLSRFEHILETWEHQQAEYQKYLDQLAKK